MLSINNIEVVYDNVILVLKGVSLEVEAGLDHDAARRQRRRQDHDAEGGVGRAAHGTRRRHQGIDHAATASASTACAAFDVTKLGIAQVFEGRRVFEHSRPRRI